MKKILLIGSSGQLGKIIKKKLLKEHNLICPSKKRGFDITKKNELGKYIKKDINYIINLSGQRESSHKNMSLTIQKGNENIIKFVKKLNSNCIVMYFSTSLVYGHSAKLKKENSKKKPIFFYEKVKYTAERNYINSKINYIIIRLSNVYGIQAKSLINLAVESVKKKKIFYFDNFKTFKNFIHINDIVNIILLLIKKNIKNETFNVGNENCSFYQIASILEKASNKKNIFVDKKVKISKTVSQIIDTSKIKKLLVNYKFQKLKKYLITSVA